MSHSFYEDISSTNSDFWSDARDRRDAEDRCQRTRNEDEKEARKEKETAKKFRNKEAEAFWSNEVKAIQLLKHNDALQSSSRAKWAADEKQRQAAIERETKLRTEENKRRIQESQRRAEEVDRRLVQEARQAENRGEQPNFRQAMALFREKKGWKRTG